MRKMKRKQWFGLGGAIALILLTIAGQSVQTIAAEQQMVESVSNGDVIYVQSVMLKDEQLDYILGRPMTSEEEMIQSELTEFYLNKSGWVELPDLGIDISLSATNPIVRGSYPSSYDSRNVNGECYIPTEVRNQNPYGNCWAFATATCIESNLMKKGLADSSIDVSEAHLIYYSNFYAKDPLENDGSDNGYHTGAYWDEGGNTFMTGRALMNWKGAVKEEVAPYSNVSVALGQDNIAMAYQSDIAHLDGWYEISAEDISAVKAAIMEYGAVATSYYHGSDSYMNYSTAAYYYNIPNTSPNHAITIIGWDDDYNKANFKIEPSANGAWLVRNSWGSKWGDDGYFWISYEDASLVSSVVAFDMELADNYDNNYQYDHASASGRRYVYVRQAASIFEVKANVGKQEELKAVSICLVDSNVNYSVQVYKNLTDFTDPTSGEACFSSPVTGNTTYSGYYTIVLPEPVKLDQGDYFSVVFSVAKDGKSTAAVEIECSSSYGSRISIASSEEKQSFVDASGYWVDWGASEESNLKIKAFTDNVDVSSVSVTGISINQKTETVKVGEQVTLSAVVSPSNATNKGIVWSSSNVSVAAVDSNGIVTGKKAGTAVIVACSVNGNYFANCTVTVEQPVSAIYFDYPTNIILSQTYQPTYINVYPTDAVDKTLTWTSSAPGTISVDSSSGEITALALGKATITATAHNGVQQSKNLEVTIPAGGYVGNINSELISFDLKQAENGGYYLTGQIVVVEWVNGQSTVPKVAPTMTFKSTDGEEAIEVFVTPTGTNTYYFDRFIEGLSANKEYVFEIASGATNNYSPYRSMNVSLATSPQMVQIKNLGKIGEQKISYYMTSDGELRLYRRTKTYVGNINSELKKTELVTGPNGNYVSGEIVVVEWEDGISTVPFETPIMYFKSTDGKETLPVWVTPTGTNTYYFDRSLGDLDTNKEYIFTIESGDSLNISPYKSMVVTTTDMENKEGILWESPRQYVKYRTDANTGQLRIYGVNK